MRSQTRLFIALVLACGVGILLMPSGPVLVAGQGGGAAVAIDADDIGGVVTGAQGPEAGAFVIAETRSTPTRLIKSVVTDDRGRYVVPDLPAGDYDVWVRGYGLVDSGKVKTRPGKSVNLKAVPAPNARATAQYFPALYWFALLQVPPKSDFPGTGDKGNGISPNIKSQGDWILKTVNTDGCNGCHQIGGPATRTIPDSIRSQFPDAQAAWLRRIQSGQSGAYMNARFSQVGRNRMAQQYADWTNRIAAGELPSATPSRPQGRERNVVITMWDWADPKTYLHDQIASDKLDPTVNANGPIYGALEESGDYIPYVDPKTNSAGQIKLPVLDPETPSSGDTPPTAPSPYWGDEAIWNSKTMAHSFAMDRQARVWATARIRKPENPAWCKAGSDNPSARLLPLAQGGRHFEMYDPKTKKVTPVDLCKGGGHVMIDANDVLWTSGGTAQGWFDLKIWDKTHDSKQANGWSAFVLDYNGNGKRDAYTDLNQPADPAKDRRINLDYYGVAVSPDGSIWGSIRGIPTIPGAVSRFMPGPNPPETALTEYYEVPWQNPKVTVQAFGPRGLDVDSKGVVWTPLSSGHLASFDRSKCKGPLNGPSAAGGQHCPEGWTMYPWPGPNYKGAVENGAADSAYYNISDRFDTLGIGKESQLAPGNLSESLLVLVDGKFMTLRVPYPMGFYAKGLDGRIDNPNGGWKGRGVFTTYATRAPFHAEGGFGITSKVVKFQMRPSPTAK